MTTANTNEDWIKTGAWDIRIDSILVTTLDQLHKALGVDGAEPADQEEAVVAFMLLPAAKPMPEDLRSAVEDAYGL